MRHSNNYRGALDGINAPVNDHSVRTKEALIGISTMKPERERLIVPTVASTLMEIDMAVQGLGDRNPSIAPDIGAIQNRYNGVGSAYTTPVAAPASTFILAETVEGPVRSPKTLANAVSFPTPKPAGFDLN